MLVRRLLSLVVLLGTVGCASSETFRDCVDCPEMVVIPTGNFMMGDLKGDGGPDERPVRKVLLFHAFAVGKFEVTFEQWNACVAGGGCSHKPDDEGWGQGDRPVINVSAADAREYIAWLNSTLDTARDGTAYRLLSESEWEYVARAGSETRYSWGDEVGAGNANCWGCGSQWDQKQTAPVGSFPANAFGVHDMHGNVAEWVEDCAAPDYWDAPSDGSAWIAGGRCGVQMTRGGYWATIPDSIRSADRRGAFFDARGNSIGFRVAKSLKPAL